MAASVFSRRCATSFTPDKAAFCCRFTASNFLWVAEMCIRDRSYPLGKSIAKVYKGEKTWSDFMKPVQRLIYKVAGVNPEEEMNWKQFLNCLLYTSGLRNATGKDSLHLTQIRDSRRMQEQETNFRFLKEQGNNTLGTFMRKMVRGSLTEEQQKLLDESLQKEICLLYTSRCV